MPIKTKEVETYIFQDLNQIEEHFKREAQSVQYIPINKYIEQNAIFMDDEFYGRGTEWVGFNEDGFRAFCDLIKLPRNFISALKKKDLASEAINDYLSNRHIQEILSNHRFVVDMKNKNTVIGIVGNRYQPYSNWSFLKDIESNFPKLLSDFKVHESYVINTNLYLRILSNDIKTGKVIGRGGSGEDISRIGLQLSNSMVGNSSIKLSYFIYRLVCANGLIVEASKTSAKVIHTGNKETFVQRLKNTIPSTVKGMNSVKNMVSDLMEIQYNPRKIVELGGAEKVYNIIPLDDSANDKRKKLRKHEDVLAFDILNISEYPSKFARTLSGQVFDSCFRDNQSMFDFVNIFTEYANSSGFSIRRRIEIEKKTGDFVNWIIENKKKLSRN